MQQIVNVLLGLLPLVVIGILLRLFLRKLRNPKPAFSDSNEMKQISYNPSLFGWGLTKERYCFDQHYLYRMKGDTTEEINLSEIVSVKPGYTTVNNRRNWVVVYSNNGLKKEARFFHNITLLNHNFAQFLVAVKQANPEADVKEISFFNV
ncbi:hypothetical protein ACTEV4_002161 [Cronobacter turicensis]|uniref:hypothetical protein n=1 Tax=Cronobacter turicensis TaxID=413502 RepID=UPI001413300C|nr:hypothetical protein [Cronobacter turicensis]NHV08099.1 hypothetical protein [Cronobacter turicensis]NHV63015.1 hypothetical protein [Cronobacter turicensis]NHW09956.1 hypothetical protein [Cronobacter turicensis]